MRPNPEIFSRRVHVSHREHHFHRQVARQFEERSLVQPFMASVAGNFAERRPARYPHVTGDAQQPIVKELVMMVTLPFEHEDT